MKTTNLIINSTDSAGKAQQKTVTYVNPNLSNADMKTFAQTINNIGTATYQGAVRVDKTDLDEDDDSDSDLSDSGSDSDSHHDLSPVVVTSDEPAPEEEPDRPTDWISRNELTDDGDEANFSFEVSSVDGAEGITAQYSDSENDEHSGIIQIYYEEELLDTPVTFSYAANDANLIVITNTNADFVKYNDDDSKVLFKYHSGDLNADVIVTLNYR